MIDLFEALIEALFRFIFYVVAYRTGRVVLGVLTPSIVCEPLEKQRYHVKRWRGFTYKKKGSKFANRDKKYYYTEAIMLAGLAFWLVAGLALSLLVAVA